VCVFFAYSCYKVLSVEVACVQQWDCIEIEEETDDNRIVKSNIRVPMQVFVQNFFHFFSEYILHKRFSAR